MTKAEIYYELGYMNRSRRKTDEALGHLQKALDTYKIMRIDKEVNRIREEIKIMAA